VGELQKSKQKAAAFIEAAKGQRISAVAMRDVMCLFITGATYEEIRRQCKLASVKRVKSLIARAKRCQKQASAYDVTKEDSRLCL
jgi:hypothetical protein